MISPSCSYRDDSLLENCTGDYRFGFNSMEGDDELGGTGNSYTTHYRQYEPRIARWFSKDPVLTAHESPYVSNRNNPIALSDPQGDCPECGPFGLMMRDLLGYDDLDFSLWGGTRVDREMRHPYNLALLGAANNGFFSQGSFDGFTLLVTGEKSYEMYRDESYQAGAVLAGLNGPVKEATARRTGIAATYFPTQDQGDGRVGILVVNVEVVETQLDRKGNILIQTHDMATLTFQVDIDGNTSANPVKFERNNIQITDPSEYLFDSTLGDFQDWLKEKHAHSSDVEALRYEHTLMQEISDGFQESLQQSIEQDARQDEEVRSVRRPKE